MGEEEQSLKCIRKKKKILACEVEFVDENGKTSSLESIKIDEIKMKINKL